MPYLTQLAAVARRTGYPVTEVSGWKSRGHGPQPAVQGIVCHHTAGATAGGDYPSLAVVRDGRPGLSGPLSHFGLGRSGRIYVIAAGRCWHNAPSTSSYHTNSNSIGIEAENNGWQAWPAAQLDAYKKLCAELCREFGLPASRVKGHKEVNTQKPDPHSVNMNVFRADVARLMSGAAAPLEEDDMPDYISVGVKDAQDLPPNQWVTVRWDKEYSDAAHHHRNAGGPSIVMGHARYSLTCNVRIEGLTPGTELQARVFEIRDSDGKVVERGPVAEYVASAGATFIHYALPAESVTKGRRVRFEVVHYGTETARLVSGTAKALAWPA